MIELLSRVKLGDSNYISYMTQLNQWQTASKIDAHSTLNLPADVIMIGNLFLPQPNDFGWLMEFRVLISVDKVYLKDRSIRKCTQV